MLLFFTLFFVLTKSFIIYNKFSLSADFSLEKLCSFGAFEANLDISGFESPQFPTFFSVSSPWLLAFRSPSFSINHFLVLSEINFLSRAKSFGFRKGFNLNLGTNIAGRWWEERSRSRRSRTWQADKSHSQSEGAVSLRRLMSFQFYAMLKLLPLSSLRAEGYTNSLALSKILSSNFILKFTKYIYLILISLYIYNID